VAINLQKMLVSLSFLGFNRFCQSVTPPTAYTATGTLKIVFQSAEARLGSEILKIVPSPGSEWNIIFPPKR
jgi:hypothetical protein